MGYVTDLGTAVLGRQLSLIRCYACSLDVFESFVATQQEMQPHIQDSILRVVENEVLRRIRGPKGYEVLERWRKYTLRSFICCYC